VLDSGTDWGHPDLLGADVAEDPSGWPAAFDPFGTLEWLAAPGRIDAGLSWYVRTTSAECAGEGDTCTVSFATRTGPSRNFDLPAGTATHDYTFPSAWTKSGTVRLGSHPDDFALALFGERPAFLVADPNKAGVYDTVYVDLNDDHAFGDEKPVTSQSPRAWRDVDGDGFVDLSGGMLYSSPTAPAPRAARYQAASKRSASRSGASRASFSPGPATSTRRSAATAGTPVPWSAGRRTPPWSRSGTSTSTSTSPRSSPTC
jgi:hypothetical protein